MLTADRVADYFLRLVDEAAGDSISNLKLQKLVYYAQAWHLALTGTPLFEDRIEAWMHGPVIPALYRTYKERGWQPIPRPTTTLEEIDAPTLGILDEVWDAYGQFSAKRLEEITHAEDPWKKARARARCGSGDPCTEPITVEDMQAYYSRQVA